MNLSTPFSPLKAISWLPVVGLGLLATANVVSSIIGVAQLVSPDTAIDLEEEGMMSVWLMLQGLIYLGSVPLHLVTIVGFLIWLYRAHANLEAFGARSLEFTPGWAVGWWFIPFANLVKPYQAVREVWYESDPDADANDNVFLSASLRTAPTYMGVWWAMWLISNIATNITSRVYDPDTMANVEIGGVLFILTGVLTAVAAGLAIMVVRDITERQGEKYSKVLAMGGFRDAPPPPPMFGSTS